MSILHVLLKMPGGTYNMEPADEATILVWNVPSNLSSALKWSMVKLSVNEYAEKNKNMFIKSKLILTNNVL